MSSTKRWALWIAAAIGFAALGCTDPGCIRNTECGLRYQCVEAVCVLRPPDGGVAGGGADEDSGNE